MSLTSLIVNRVINLPKITSYSRFLFVGPHPDDIEIGAGALAAKLVRMGKHVSFVICTDGRFGTENMHMSANEMAEMRKQESLLAAEELGVKDVSFLGFSDAGFYDQKDLEKALLDKIFETQPEVIFAPDPCVKNECHKDHLIVGDIVRRISFFTGFENIMNEYGIEATDFKALGYYMTDKPNQFVKVSGDDFKKQLKSIFSCHVSQYPPMADTSAALESYLKVRSLDFGLRKFSAHAEGIRFLDKIRMHCLPEGK